MLISRFFLILQYSLCLPYIPQVWSPPPDISKAGKRVFSSRTAYASCSRGILCFSSESCVALHLECLIRVWPRFCRTGRQYNTSYIKLRRASVRKLQTASLYASSSIFVGHPYKLLASLSIYGFLWDGCKAGCVRLVKIHKIPG